MVVQPLFAFLLLTCSVLQAIILICDAAYPSPYGLDSGLAASDCGSPAPVNHDLIPVRREVYGGGRIIDISHRYNPDMPSWGSDSGIGQFLWLPKSMKNGSLANNSEMKLPAHTGTHVDSPGHVFDQYFDAGFDVDTLDLEVLNGRAIGPPKSGGSKFLTGRVGESGKTSLSAPHIQLSFTLVLSTFATLVGI